MRPAGRQAIRVGTDQKEPTAGVPSRISVQAAKLPQQFPQAEQRRVADGSGEAGQTARTRGSSGFGFDRGGHRTFATGDQRIFPEGMNLVAFQFRMFASGGEADGFSLLVDFVSDLVPLFGSVAEQLPHHADHVLIRVLIVVPEHHVVAGLPFGLLVRLFFGRGLCSRFWRGDGRLALHGNGFVWAAGVGCARASQGSR